MAFPTDLRYKRTGELVNVGDDIDTSSWGLVKVVDVTHPDPEQPPGHDNPGSVTIRYQTGTTVRVIPSAANCEFVKPRPSVTLVKTDPANWPSMKLPPMEPDYSCDFARLKELARIFLSDIKDRELDELYSSLMEFNKYYLTVVYREPCEKPMIDALANFVNTKYIKRSLK